MRLYSKKLSSLHELRREKQSLKKQINGKEKAREDKDTPEEKENFITGLLSGVTSGSLLTTVLNVAPTIFDLVKGRALKSKVRQTVAPKTDKNGILGTVVKEFVGGYVKWKVLELAFKGIKIVLKSDTSKKLQAKTAASLKKTFKKK